MTPERIEDIVAFVRAADARSFTAAAEQLGLSRSTIGKRITRLEARLGVRLLYRTTRSVALTDEGATFHDACLRILQDLESAEVSMAVRNSAPRGRLRIDVPVSLGRLQVLPVVHRYMEQWPDVAISISFTDRFVDLVEEGIDVAVRVGGMVDSSLVARTIAPHHLVTCASPAYLSRHAEPTTIGELSGRSCLTYQHAGRPMDWRFQVDGRRETVAVDGRFSSSNAESLRDAVLAGFGIGQLATFLIAEDLQAGRLVPVLAPLASDGEPIHVIYPSRQHLAPKVKAFVELLSQSWLPAPPWARLVV